MNLVNALDVATRAAQDAGDLVAAMRDDALNVRPKHRRDIVTSADMTAQARILEALTTAFPDHRFATEETDSEAKEMDSADWNWVIDPLDGTVNYAAGLTMFSTSIALLNGAVPQLGVIYVPAAQEMYSCTRGGGCYLNGLPIRVSDSRTLDQAILAVMLPSHYSDEEIDSGADIVAKLARVTRGVRLFVSQALELAYTASGQLAGTVSEKIVGFSSAAGVLMVREAGGRATDFEGAEFRTGSSTTLVASNGFTHDEVLETIARRTGQEDA